MPNIAYSLLAAITVLPLSVGNHTNYNGGGTHTGGFTGGGMHTGGGGLGGFYFLGGHGGTGGLGFFGGIITIIVIIVIIALVVKGFRQANSSVNFNSAPAQPVIPRDDEITAKIKEHDPEFSRERFLSFAEQVFVQLQQAWTERDWKKARPFESQELFNLHKSQLDEYIRNGTINIMENVCVNESYLCDYAAEEKFEFLTVFMNTRYNDYIVKEDTKEVIKGDSNCTYSVQYKLKFMRTIGVKTSEMSNKSTVQCPNCGAPVDVNESGQCAYCGTIITSGEHDWVLCNMDDVNQF